MCRFCKIHAKNYKTVYSCSTGKEFSLWDYINCDSYNVVYAVECTLCTLQYMDCTKRPLRTRVFMEHCIKVIRDCQMFLSILNMFILEMHLKYVHLGDMSYFTFYGLEIVRKPPIGGNTHRKLLEREVWCIFNLKMRIPVGMNYRCGSVFTLVSDTSYYYH